MRFRLGCVVVLLVSSARSFADSSALLTPSPTVLAVANDAAAAANPMLAVEAQSLAARRPVPLKEALLLTSKNNTDLKAARAQAAQVAAQAGLALSAILPELTFSASYVHTTVEQKFDTKSLQEGIAAGLVGAIQTVGPAYGLTQRANAAVLNSAANLTHLRPS